MNGTMLLTAGTSVVGLNTTGLKRLGRKTRHGESGRKQVCKVLQNPREALANQGKKTMAMVYCEQTGSTANPFHTFVVDECQDVSPSQLRFLSRLAERHSGQLSFAGDLRQCIFQAPFSWSSTRRRSKTLKN
ncbi:UvrD-helicase domain-containing protein [Rhodopirellula sp. JC639]|uniref:UvrD-helicase domain-containing protein n=1 Tax=Stieleria mannarensis TaxID=2755585 RepID=UPI00336A2F09